MPKAFLLLLLECLALILFCWCHGPYWRHYRIIPNVTWTVCGCHVVWYWCGRSGVFSILNSGLAALALSAWLPWLGATSQVRGQFGVALGSNVLPNKAAGPQDRVRPVSWQQALPPTPNHGSSRPGGDWDCRAPFSFHQLQFICSYNLALDKLTWTIETGGQ